VRSWQYILLVVLVYYLRSENCVWGANKSSRNRGATFMTAPFFNNHEKKRQDGKILSHQKQKCHEGS
jgi:hypothetical protein